MIRRPPTSTLFPYTTLIRSRERERERSHTQGVTRGCNSHWDSLRPLITVKKAFRAAAKHAHTHTHSLMHAHMYLHVHTLTHTKKNRQAQTCTGTHRHTQTLTCFHKKHMLTLYVGFAINQHTRTRTHTHNHFWATVAWDSISVLFSQRQEMTWNNPSSELKKLQCFPLSFCARGRTTAVIIHSRTCWTPASFTVILHIFLHFSWNTYF